MEKRNTKPTLEQLLEDHFKENPACPKVYSSSDNFLFENLKYAQDHAATLDDSQLDEHLNPNLFEVVVSEDSEDSDEDTPES